MAASGSTRHRPDEAQRFAGDASLGNPPGPALAAATVAVVGLGYVGLPLAVEFGKRYRTIGFDLSKEKVASYRQFVDPVSYTHLRAHETGRNLVCRLLLEKKKNKK